MFDGASECYQNIGPWDTSKVSIMTDMFYRTSIFNQNIRSWNVVRVTGNARMFGAWSIQQCDFLTTAWQNDSDLAVMFRNENRDGLKTKIP
jgi:hypothetical protein